MGNEKTKCVIKNIDMEKLTQQAEFIAGLAQVFSIYSESQSDKYLSYALEALCRRAIKHLDYCNTLSDKLESYRKIDINSVSE